MDSPADQPSTPGSPLPPPVVTLAAPAPPPPAQARPVPPVATSRLHPSSVGRVTGVWRFLIGLAWAAGFFALAAVWQASVQLGIGLWWVGPRAQPTSVWLRMVPFVACLTMVVFAVYGIRRLAELSILFSLLLGVFALPDFSRSTGLAATEVAIAGALLLVGLVSLTGRIRPAAPVAAPVAAPGGEAHDG